MAEDLAFLSATHLLALYRTKDLSPAEVTGETLRRLERYEGALNAFVLYDPEEAMTQARASEARWQKGEPEGLLDGVPVAIKDTVLTRSWPRLLGSRTIDPNQLWNEDSPVTARLRSEGAVFFAKTTTPEFGWKPVKAGLPATHGTSSVRPAAAVAAALPRLAAGICPLAVGTDAGGSIHIPAAFCGIVGLKPTFGLVAVHPPSVFGDVAHVGCKMRA
jgi:aspartyl-tRNA(Asn)/glutamyl-tRNA(Gln) amidotransferase subunit A